MTTIQSSARLALTGLAWCVLCAGSCATAPADSAPPDTAATGSRSFRMGFSGFPPKNDFGAAVASITMWSTRADAAIFHVEIPWKLLLTGGDVAGYVTREFDGLTTFYRSKSLPIFVTFDGTDGLARDKEARELRELGRSIAEPIVQQRFREFVRSVVTLVRPQYVGLGAETNLVRLAAPRGVYDGLRAMTAAAAADVRANFPSITLYTTVQAEVAWGRLPRTNRYEGVDEDLRDFPWIQALGVSSYPYLGGFSAPSEIPLDYLSRLTGGRALPLFIAEGGWSSASVTGVASSASQQAAYIRRFAEVALAARAVAWLQLNFADMDVTSFVVPAGYDEILSLFTRLGLVDSELRPKPALTAWDSIFALPRR